MADEHTQMYENDSLIESFIPTDFTDVGQGTVLYEAYHHKLRYCEGVGWIAYNGGLWEPSETAAHSYSQRLTDLQMQEAKTMGHRCRRPIWSMPWCDARRLKLRPL